MLSCFNVCLPDNILVIKAANQLHLAHDSLVKLSALWVKRNPLHSIQTVVKLISYLQKYVKDNMK